MFCSIVHSFSSVINFVLGNRDTVVQVKSLVSPFAIVVKTHDVLNQFSALEMHILSCYALALDLICHA